MVKLEEEVNRLRTIEQQVFTSADQQISLTCLPLSGRREADVPLFVR